MAKSYYNIVEVLVNIYKVENGKLKIFLKKKQTDPYKDYYILPGTILDTSETLEDASKKIINDNVVGDILYLKEAYNYSNLDRDPDARIIGCNYLAIVNTGNNNFFEIKDIPLLGYDHQKIVKDNIELLKNMIRTNNDEILFKLFPDTFTLIELKNFIEELFGIEIDKRNFRKKLLVNGSIISYGERVTNKAGRPSKLYKFNPNVKEVSVI